MSVAATSRSENSTRPSRNVRRSDWTRETAERSRPSASRQSWPTEIRRAPRPQAADESSGTESIGFAETASQLFHMMLASLEGYRDIADTSTDSELRTMAEIIVRQRRAQCRALAELAQSERYSPWDADPAAEKVKSIWLLAMWHFDQGETSAFFEYAEAAEMILEEACLSAAQIYSGAPGANLFEQFAMTVCGALQRLEELSGGRI